MAAAATLSAGSANAASVEIRDAAARVTVVPQDRSDIKVEIVKAHPQLPLTVSVSGDRTLVDGDLHRRIQDCDDMDHRANVKVRGVGRVKYDDLPQVVIYTPRDVDVTAGGAVQGAIGRSESPRTAQLRLRGLDHRRRGGRGRDPPVRRGRHSHGRRRSPGRSGYRGQGRSTPPAYATASRLISPALVASTSTRPAV